MIDETFDIIVQSTLLFEYRNEKVGGLSSALTTL